MSGVGSPLDALSDLMLTTPPWFATGIEKYVNEATKRTYLTSRMQTGREFSEMIQGGESIRDDIMFDIVSNRQYYDPNEPLNYRLENVLTQHRAPWTFCVTPISWTEHEIGLNFGQLRGSEQKKVFKRLYKAKMMKLWTDISNGEEEDAFRQPAAAMEQQSGGKMAQSLMHWVHEFTTGVAPGVTTIQQLSPTTYPKWDNPRETYVGLATATPTADEARDLGRRFFSALTKLWRRMSFDQMPHGPEYSDPRTRPDFIGMSMRGVSMYEDSLRVNNEMLLGNRQDPAYPEPMFRGMPVHYFSELDNAAVFSASAGAAFGTEETATVTGPRAFMFNTMYGKRMWHEDRYFIKRMVSHSRQPFTKTMVVDQWGNYFVSSRRKFGGIVYPITTSVGAYSFPVAA